jgi:3-deoxy-D-manno-octulosonic-acid transferase
MGYLVYNVLITLAFLVALPVLPLLLLGGERFRAGFAQRLGWYSIDRAISSKAPRPLWIHAASVGEVRSVRALSEQLRRRFPDRAIILSTLTHTGNLTARQNPTIDRVIYLPVDLWWTVERALAVFDPAVLIFIETEVWPNLLRQAHRKGLPTILLSGRVSEKGFKNYCRFGWFFKGVFRLLKACGMQSEIDRQRIIRLGAAPSRVSITGNLKHAAVLNDGTAAADNFHEQRPAGSWMWVVGSSHRGEEEIVCGAFKTLKQQFPRLRMILAPRHPQRFAEVEKRLVDSGVSFEKKSSIGTEREFQHDVLLLDTIGDLESFYAEADLAFVGGSLVDAGGHNLLEPARLRKPVFFGPYTSNVNLVARQLKQNGGGFEVRGAEDLVREITGLLSDPQKRRLAGEKAFEVAVTDNTVIDQSLNVVAGYLSASAPTYLVGRPNTRLVS